MRKFWIDTDTASDDAVALVMALRWPDVDVVGVSLVAGNVPVAQGLKNALYSIQLSTTKHVPVYVGCAKPLLRPIEFATWFHGSDGMGEMNYPDAVQQPETQHAIDALIDAVRANPGEITLVTLGPLTNIAAALTKAPEIAGMIPRCVIMGGAANVVGNVTPAAEYNIWVDPEAASIVFHSGMNMEMVGWELCRFDAALTPPEMEQVYAIGTEIARFAMDCNRTALEVCMRVQKATGITLADPVAMAVALDAETVVTRRGHYFVEVETLSPYMRGNTCVDELGVSKRTPNMHVIWAIDNPRWKEILFQTLR